jgi:hypothetical protein
VKVPTIVSDENVRIIAIGTEQWVDQVLRGHRPDVERAEVLRVTKAEQLRGRSFRADVAIWHTLECRAQDHLDAVALAVRRRVLPAVLPRNKRKDIE